MDKRSAIVTIKKPAYQGENPTVVVLANTYYTLNYCHEKKGRNMVRRFSECPINRNSGVYQLQLDISTQVVGTSHLSSPTKEAITPFVVYGLGAQNRELLKKIRQAWRNIIRKEHEWGHRSYGTSNSYKIWLRLRVEQAKLPFDNTFLTTEKELALDI
ncbi:hypothetical protein CR513_49547, partial [Mucuna pruriens]